MRKGNSTEAVLQYAQNAQLESVCVSDSYLDAYIQSFEQRFTQVQFLRQESGFLHNSFEWGYLIYESVKKNDKQELTRLLNGEKSFRYGVLSKEKLRSAKDLVICLISAIIQFAMLDRIVEAELAFTAADVCIQLIEEAETVNDVVCHAHASLYKLSDFIEEYRQRNYHPIVQQAKEYIHQHAHEPIRTGQLAQALGVSREKASACVRISAITESKQRKSCCVILSEAFLISAAISAFLHKVILQSRSRPKLARRRRNTGGFSEKHNC